MKNKLAQFIVLTIIVILAFFVRTYNINWDSGTHIHPDERFLTMVTSDMRLPNSFGDYLNPQVSTMNPHNINYGFFVYGTFPLYLVKILAILLKMDDYGNIPIVGRIVSAIFDTGIVVILFLFTRTLLNCSIVPLLNKDKRRWKQKNADTKLNNGTMPHQNKFDVGQVPQWNNHICTWLPFIPSFLYSIMVLPIQLSHFFAVDTFLAFFMILSFCIGVLIHRYILQSKWIKVFLFSILLGIAFGLGLASKVTMFFILPLDLLIVSLGFIQNFAKKNIVYFLKFDIWKLFGIWILIFAISILFFRVVMPMAFSTGDLLNPALNPKWIKNLTDLQSMSTSSLSNTFPPAIQWFHTSPITYPLKNMILWGMGIPLAGLCIVSLIYFFFYYLIWLFRAIINAANLKFKVQNSKLQFKIQNGKTLNNLTINQYNNITIFLLILFVFAFFFYQSTQFVKAMRYFYPIYWCLALISGLFIGKIAERAASIHKKISISLTSLIFFISLIVYPISFLQIYARPQTRVAASRWIFENIPAGKKVTFEEWDDPLPLSVDGKPVLVSGIPLPMFWPDSEEKWNNIIPKLIRADYVILSSNRVYGSASRRPDIYSTTELYYELLFSEKLGFTKIKNFSSHPTIPIINLEFNDDAADESFTVYDHPRVMIFKKNKSMSIEEYKNLLKL